MVQKPRCEHRKDRGRALLFHHVVCRPYSVSSQSDVAQFPMYMCYFCKLSPALTIFSVS